ncbi:DUF494 family protein [Legionella quateirensis]|uniref:Uncharacterized protein conserved in bacteria n=1 Tax=Legionella quateirensis TaxID=45072 RepID=A0A378KR59_9GAMM|nr:DUF494 family protein [Legionella quateirensis]KTD44686.1 hypothetical protein Lqua_2853 [Legionella quateirensis]STY16796.1 Uncharacterized protein conserved in bacteria [Legionella quateirensis]
MKDNLFEMLLNLFEKSLNQLQKSHKSDDQGMPELTEDDEIFHTEEQALFIKTAQEKSIRIVTYEEQMKLTKASYQFLMRMKLWGIIDVNLFELIINQLHSSESRIITLQETKWTIRNVLENHMDEEQLAFLDIVLYQTEDELTLN